MYKLTGVTRDYQQGRRTVQALQGVNLVIEDGEWLAIQGPTGHGKSTLLQILGGLDRPTRGVVELDGRNLATLGEGPLTKVRAASIGFIFQTFNLIPTLSAQENVETALVPLGVAPAKRRGQAREALTEVGLGDRPLGLGPSVVVVLAFEGEAGAGVPDAYVATFGSGSSETLTVTDESTFPLLFAWADPPDQLTSHFDVFWFASGNPTALGCFSTAARPFRPGP